MRFSYLKFDSNVSSGKLTTEMTEQRRNTQHTTSRQSHSKQHGSMGGGLKKGSDDYNLVAAQIKSGQWKVDGNIPHRAILDFNVENGNWVQDKYDYNAFSSSVRSLVSELRLEPGGDAGGESAGGMFDVSCGALTCFDNETAADVLLVSSISAEEHHGPTPTQEPAPMAPTMASGSEMIENDELVVRNAFHLFTWQGQSDNEMVTLVAKLPSAITADNMEAYIHDNRQIVMEFREPMCFADPALLMERDTFNGRPFHNADSNIVSAMRDSCYNMKGNVSTKPVVSVQRVDLPFEVHSQFSTLDVPMPLRVVPVSLPNNEVYRVFIAHAQRQSQVRRLMLSCIQMMHRISILIHLSYFLDRS
jgi:hypothetical protein